MPSNSLGKILVVDDEVELKNVLVEALGSQGYETFGFDSAAEALGALREQAFDVLLTDLMMPGMDGITLVKESLQIDPHLVCIMMTGQATIQTAVDAMKVGAFDYILKPFRLQTMLPGLTRAMNARHLRLENVQLREAVAIHELSETIAFTLDPQTVLSKLADAALRQSEADEVSILLPTRDNKELYVAAVRGEKRERLLGERIPLQDSISSWVARERTSLILNGAVADERFVALWPRSDIRSAVSVPMQVANKLVGVINLNMTSHLRPFTLGQMKALTILAGTAAAALESASLYQQVQEAEKKYRSIFENAVEGMFQSSPDRRFITVNPSLARILGYESPAEVLSAFDDVRQQLWVRPELAAGVTRILEDVGVVEGFEFEAYRKDRGKIWLSLNIRLVRDQTGGAALREGTIEDITARKRAEHEQARLHSEIKQQTDRLNTIVATVPGVVFEVSGSPRGPGNKTNFVSEYIGPMLGYTVSEWLAVPGFWLSIVHPDDRERVFEEASTEFAQGTNGGHEFRWVGKDGRIVWVRAHTIIVRGKDGEPVGVRGVVTDITEHKRSEQELIKSEERYRDLVENAHDIIYSQDLQGRYTSMNQAGAQITGYTVEEALALNIDQTVAPEFLAKSREMLRRKLEGDDVTAYEMEIVAKDGHRITVEANTKLVFQDGVPVGVQGIARDVTERKLLEEQLRQSQKMEAIGQLAGGVAHDFNNLLTAINGYSGLALQRIDENHPLRGYLEEIKKAGDRAANLTRQLLAFGRKQILQPLPINLNDVVADMNKMLRRLIGEDIVLTATLDSELKRIKADPGQIEQVLMNLVVNARDAMPQGGNLTIETASVELDQDYADRHVGVVPGKFVMLAVSDTGTGMDEATQAKIFDPFFTTKEKGKGTGLGLSTVYGIIRQSGGSIWVYSECGHGTTFKVYLPQMAIEPQRAEAIVALPEPRGVETILLVEDEDVVRGLAKQILEQSGYKVLAAARGAEAIGLCQQSVDPIHLVLTDVVMPEISGKEVADRLRELRPGVRVLFMSGYTDAAIVHHGVLDSNIEFIQKPFTPVALIRKVREVLDSELMVSD